MAREYCVAMSLGWVVVIALSAILVFLSAAESAFALDEPYSAEVSQRDESLPDDEAKVTPQVSLNRRLVPGYRSYYRVICHDRHDYHIDGALAKWFIKVTVLEVSSENETASVLFEKLSSADYDQERVEGQIPIAHLPGTMVVGLKLNEDGIWSVTSAHELVAVDQQGEDSFSYAEVFVEGDASSETLESLGIVEWVELEPDEEALAPYESWPAYWMANWGESQAYEEALPDGSPMAFDDVSMQDLKVDSGLVYSDRGQRIWYTANRIALQCRHLAFHLHAVLLTDSDECSVVTFDDENRPHACPVALNLIELEVYSFGASFSIKLTGALESSYTRASLKVPQD